MYIYLLNYHAGLSLWGRWRFRWFWQARKYRRSLQLSSQLDFTNIQQPSLACDSCLHFCDLSHDIQMLFQHLEMTVTRSWASAGRADETACFFQLPYQFTSCLQTSPSAQLDRMPIRADPLAFGFSQMSPPPPPPASFRGRGGKVALSIVYIMIPLRSWCPLCTCQSRPLLHDWHFLYFLNFLSIVLRMQQTSSLLLTFERMER